MSNVSREIQSSEGGNRDVARLRRDFSASERRQDRIAQSHERDLIRRQKRALGPIDTIDYEALDLLQTALASQVVKPEGTFVVAEQELTVKKSQVAREQSFGQRIRDAAKTARVMLALPI